MNDLQVFFNQLNSFFDAVYVITLERATDRHAHIEKELMGLKYHLFFGKDKAEFSIEDLKEKKIYDEKLAIQHHRYSKPLNGGQIGCAWSHKLVYEDVLAKNYSRVLILEDDIVIDKKLMHIFSQALDQLPPDWELWFFGYERYEKFLPFIFFKQLIYHIQKSLGLIKFSHRSIKNLYAKKINSHISRAGYHDHSHAYAITGTAAKKLHQLQHPITYVADNLLAEAATNEIVKAYSIVPKLINQLSQELDPTFKSTTAT